jgi:hypothetical protein
MPLLELSALLILALYVLYQTRGQPKPGHFIAKLAIVSAGSWIAEESSILLYNFYSYSPAWSLFLGHVPVMVIVIWPVIIHSAWELASQLLRPNRGLVPAVAAAIVCSDALFIEPLASHAGLWTWNEPGIFDVPPVAILGWTYFAFLCILLLEWGSRPNVSIRTLLPVLLLPAICTHLLLLGTWWAAFRWISTPFEPKVVAGAAWAISLLLVCVILLNMAGKRVERKTLLLRLPAAVLLFTLLALKVTGPTSLVVYAVAFAPPYLTLMAQQYLNQGSRRKQAV